MMQDHKVQEMAYNIFSKAVKDKALQLVTEDEELHGRTMTIEGRTLINFGSCSYLGLEMDNRIRAGIMDGAKRYGSQFSSSRAYVSATLYATLDELTEQIFGAYPLVATTTTLGHLSALPVMISNEDCIILDNQVHASVQMASRLCKCEGTALYYVEHNRMDLLEEMIEKFKKTHRHIWYLADGVYSMYGDLAPVEALRKLLDRHDQFYAYLDDAHGMSWTGKHGRGHVLGDSGELHPKMVVATSFVKAFAAGGAALIFPKSEWRQIVRTCGGTMTFSGPIQPPMLGGSIASARIHLSDDIYTLQNALKERIRHFNAMAAKYDVPLSTTEITPLRYVPIGDNNATITLMKTLMTEGFYVNFACFPVVPMKQSGLRIALNNHLTLDDIEGLVRAVRHHMPEIKEKSGISAKGKQ